MLPSDRPMGSGETLLQGLCVQPVQRGSHWSHVSAVILVLPQQQPWDGSSGNGGNRSFLEKKGNVWPGQTAQFFTASQTPGEH